jgi:hypothetical protein
LNFGEPNEHEKADSLLFDYMVSHFKINTTSTLDFSFVGKEVNLDEMLWVYIESTELEKPKLLEVENTFLIDDFEAQSNITHVNFLSFFEYIHYESKTWILGKPGSIQNPNPFNPC